MKRSTATLLIPIIFLSIVSCKNGSNDHSGANSEGITPDSLVVDQSDSIVTRVGIKMDKRGGVYEIPCEVNGVPMRFIFDTGASNVCLSLTEASFLYKNGYLSDTDFIGESHSKIADGSIIENMEIMLKTIVVGGIEINNVRATVVKSNSAPLLFGQTAIQKFGRVEFVGDSLYITHKTLSTFERPKTSEINPNIIQQGSKLSRSRFGRTKSPKVEALLEQAIEAYNNDLPERAIQYCRNALDINIKDWRIYALLGQYEGYGTDEYEQFKRLNVKQESFCIGGTVISWEEVVSDLAYRYLANGWRPSTGEAISTCQELVLYNPQNISALRNLSLAYAISEKYDNALLWAERVMKLSQKEGYFCLGYIYSCQGRDTETIQAYEKCLEIDPAYNAAIYNLANQYYKIAQVWAPVMNKSYFENLSEAQRLHIIAAKNGYKASQKWLKEQKVNW